MVRRTACAVIGTGKVAHVHAKAYASSADARLIAVYGRSRERAEAFAAEYGAKPYWDLSAMLGSGTVEVASICTPHPTHPDIAVACAAAGIHQLVEKPLAIDVEGADRAIAANLAADTVLGVVSQRRFYPAVVRMKVAIEAGKIGPPRLGVVTVLGWRDPDYYRMDPWRGTWDGEGGGVLVNQAVHQLDLLLWFMGPANDVAGFCTNVNHPTIEVEDTAVASIRFGTGALGAIVASNSQKPGLYAKVHVHGQNGSSVGVQTDGGSTFVAGLTTTVEPALNDIWTVAGEESCLAAWQAEDRAEMAGVDVTSYYHALQIADFLGAVRDHRPPAVTGEDGRRVAQLLAAVYEFGRERRVVGFDRT